jgi:hypothetical protein
MGKQRFESATARHDGRARPSRDYVSGLMHAMSFSASAAWSVLPLAVMGQSVHTKKRLGTL